MWILHCPKWIQRSGRRAFRGPIRRVSGRTRDCSRRRSGWPPGPNRELPRQMDAWLRRTLAGEPWPYVMGAADRPRRALRPGSRRRPRDRPLGRPRPARDVLLDRQVGAGHGRRAGLRRRLARRPRRAGRRPGAADRVRRRSPRRRRRGSRDRRHDHLAPAPDPDQRLARRPLRRSLVGRPAGQTAAHRPAPRPRRALCLQRRPHQPLLARPHPPARRRQRRHPGRARPRPDRGRRGLELAGPAADADDARRRRRGRGDAPAAATGAAASG